MKGLGFRILVALFLLLAMLSPAGCSKQEEPVKSAPDVKDEEVKSEDVKREIKEAVDATRAYTIQQRQEYQKKLEAELQEFNRRIDDLKSKAEQSGAEARAKLDKQIEELGEKREVVRKKLEELKAAGEKAWEEFKVDLENAADDYE